jgi:hypothetical protein
MLAVGDTTTRMQYAIWCMLNLYTIWVTFEKVELETFLGHKVR